MPYDCPVCGWPELSQLPRWPDGSASFETMRLGDARDAERLGADAGAELKGHAAPDFFMV